MTCGLLSADHRRPCQNKTEQRNAVHLSSPSIAIAGAVNLRRPLVEPVKVRLTIGVYRSRTWRFPQNILKREKCGPYAIDDFGGFGALGTPPIWLEDWYERLILNSFAAWWGGKKPARLLGEA